MRKVNQLMNFLIIKMKIEKKIIQVSENIFGPTKKGMTQTCKLFHIFTPKFSCQLLHHFPSSLILPKKIISAPFLPSPLNHSKMSSLSNTFGRSWRTGTSQMEQDLESRVDDLCTQPMSCEQAHCPKKNVSSFPHPCFFNSFINWHSK